MVFRSSAVALSLVDIELNMFTRAFTLPGFRTRSSKVILPPVNFAATAFYKHYAYYIKFNIIP